MVHYTIDITFGHGNFYLIVPVEVNSDSIKGLDLFEKAIQEMAKCPDSFMKSCGVNWVDGSEILYLTLENDINTATSDLMWCGSGKESLVEWLSSYVVEARIVNKKILGG